MGNGNGVFRRQGGEAGSTGVHTQRPSYRVSLGKPSPIRARETVVDRVDGGWRVWINNAPDWRHGTFCILYDNGVVEEVQLYPGREPVIIEVRTSDD